MLSLTGSALIVLAVFTTVFAIVSLTVGIASRDDRWLRAGRRALWAASALSLLALILLGFAFLNDQFQIRYVALHSSVALPVHLKLTAIWAGQEGSLLLWAFLQVLFAALVSRRVNDSSHQSLFAWATVILSAIALFFVAITLLFSNPFIKLSPVPVDGQGMNPLLRHPGMIFHPPVLFVGYVGLAVPFALALAALLVGQVDAWLRDARRWLLLAWIALGLGIILGARWAYDVLGWGGYWGWDPVENAALMPWLLATGLLHGLVMQARGKGFKVWNLTLATLSFALVLFGTFTTRSGLIQSVHAFSRSNLGPYFLGLIGLVVLGTFTMMFLRRKAIGELIYPERLVSREGAFFFTLLLLTLITLSILAGTLLPTITGGRFAAPPAWFNQVVGPQLAALVFLMGVGPLLGRAVRSSRASLWRGLPWVLGLVGGMVTGYLLGFTAPAVLIGLAMAGFAGGAALGEIGFGLATRLRRKRPLSLGGQYGLGGHLVHLGVVLMALGVIGTQNYATDQNLTLVPGSAETVQGYTLVYERLVQETAVDHVETWAVISVYRDSQYVTTLNPQITYYPAYGQTMAEPAIHAGLREDLYLVLFQFNPSETISLTVKINPLSNFLWMGGLVLLLGGVMAWWPRGSRGEEGGKWRKIVTQIGAWAGLSLIIVLAVTMWGSANGSSRRSGRPLVGEPAPTFSAMDVDGRVFDLGDQKGRVVVINFWATWCPQCEDELPAFQAVWEDYRQRDVAFVGVAMADDEEAVRETAVRFGLGYPLIVERERAITSLYGVTAVPETFVVDAKGDVVQVQIGAMTEAALRQALDSALNP